MNKVLIVEDEPILRQGIVTLIDWNSLSCQVVGECSNGVEAVNFLNQTPVDIVISDIKMPGMDGLELAAHIQQHWPKIPVILLTAYSEFEYAKAAIGFDVVDYVLKKDFVQTLPKSIERVLAEKAKKEATAPTPMASSALNLSDLVFSGILDGTLSQPEEIKSFLSQYSIALDQYFVLLLEVVGLSSGESLKKTKEEIQRILNIFSTAFQKHSQFYQILSPHDIYFVLSGTWSSAKQANHYMIQVCQDIADMLTDYTEYAVHIGISGYQTDFTQLQTAGKQAKIAASYIFGDQQVRSFDLIDQRAPATETLDVSAVCRQLLRHINPLDNAAIQRILREFFTGNLKYHSIDKIKMDTNFLISLCCDALTEYGIDSDTRGTLRDAATQSIVNKHTPRAIEQELLLFMEDIAQHTGSFTGGTHRVVHQVNDFIKTNYALPIKLDDIADFLHVNSSYLSRLYKKETGESLITALNRYRIKKAKELLQSGDYLVAQVGEMVGIENPSYFTKVFTKEEGVNQNKIEPRSGLGKMQKPAFRGIDRQKQQGLGNRTLFPFFSVNKL